MKPQNRPTKQIDLLPATLYLNQGLSELTPREWEILLRIADDLTNTEIADLLDLTPKSVENYHTRIGSKLDLQGQHKLGKFARKHLATLRQRYEQLIRELPPTFPKK